MYNKNSTLELVAIERVMQVGRLMWSHSLRRWRLGFGVDLFKSWYLGFGTIHIEDYENDQK